MAENLARRKILTTPILNSNVQKEEPSFDQKDDLTETYKQEYASYTAELTKNDQYPLSKDYEPLPAFTNEGAFTVPITEVADTQATSLKEVDTKTRSLFTNTSNSSQLANEGEDTFQIRKGKENVQGPTPLFFFDDAQKNKQNSVIAGRVRRLLVNNNGLDKYGIAAISEGTASAGNSAESTTSARQDEDRVVGVATPQNLPLGVSPGRKFPEATPAVLDAHLIKIRDLKKLGLAVMLGASGELVEPNYQDKTFETTGVAKFELLSTPPSLTRLGQKIPVSRFSAAKAFEKISPGSGLGNNKVSPLLEVADEGTSYGSPYNPAVPASGVTSVPQIVAAGALVLAFGTLLKTTAAIISATSKARGSTVHPDFSRETRRRHLGKAYGTADINTDDQFINTGFGFDVATTRFDFGLALNKGVEVFFAGTIDSPAAVTAGVIGNVTKTPGFYSGVLMEILRDLELLGVGSSTGNAADTVRELGDPQNIITNIKESKLFRFVNILAALGDIALTAKMLANGENISGVTDVYTEDEFYRESISVDIPETNINSSSKKLLDPSVHQIKYRLSDGKSSWANNALRSLLLYPTAIGDGKRLLGIRDRGGEVLRSHAVVPDDSGINPVSGRIKQATVEAMEKYLEKDYIPFYFHDVRTNEVVTTPAFLESLEESFTVEYAETEGFGRIGTVPVYKNTKRSISLSFIMISLNDDDHSMMWYKINRLGMMLMPQWTKGRQIQFGSNRIIQPFSQQIAASPLIRLRLGDLYKTNYSQFGLARLFGVASGGGASNSNSFNLENFDQNTTAVTNAREEQRRRTAAAEAILTRQSNVELSLKQRFQIGDRIRISAGNYTYRDTPPAGSIASTPTTGPNVGNRVRGSRARASNDREPINAAEVRVVGYYGGTEERPDCLLVELVTASSAPSTGGASNNRQYMVESGPRIIPDISLINPPLGAQPNEPQNQTTTANVLSTQEFMSDKNPIFKAYKSTRGKGIPGFITSFSLGIDTKHLWLIEKFNARAPQIVTISLQFNPLYDIQPGLDHNGFMTAPLWNVGDVMKANFSDTTAGNEIKSDDAREVEYNSALQSRGTPRRIL